MTFPHSDPGRFTLKQNMERAISSHGKEEYLLKNPLGEEALRMRAEEHPDIKLNGIDLAYLRGVLFERKRDIERRISAPDNAQSTELEQELKLLQDLAEKLFKKTD